MKIYLVNHYAVPPKYYPLSRPSFFAKNLMKMGHDVTIIASSSVHNSKGDNLINDGSEVKHIIDDDDLENQDTYKIVYTGSIRKVNNLGKLLDVAREIKNQSIKFLILGDGDQLNALKQRIVDENIDNVIFKGKVEKKYVPYITSRADLNYAHNDSSPLFRFGISFNKIFDYLAAGKPIICDFYSKYNPVIQENAGLAIESGDIKEMSNNAREAANKYDFKNLANKLIEVINNVKEKK